VVLRAVCYVNRKQLLLYAHRSEPNSRAISIPLKINRLVISLETQCF